MHTRIVIIEDNIEIREGFVAVLNNAGQYDVVNHYSNCEDALKHLADDAPDIVLMDIELPV